MSRTVNYEQGFHMTRKCMSDCKFSSLYNLEQQVHESLSKQLIFYRSAYFVDANLNCCMLKFLCLDVDIFCKEAKKLYHCLIIIDPLSYPKTSPIIKLIANSEETINSYSKYYFVNGVVSPEVLGVWKPEITFSYIGSQLIKFFSEQPPIEPKCNSFTPPVEVITQPSEPVYGNQTNIYGSIGTNTVYNPQGSNPPRSPFGDNPIPGNNIASNPTPYGGNAPLLTPVGTGANPPRPPIPSMLTNGIPLPVGTGANPPRPPIPPMPTNGGNIPLPPPVGLGANRPPPFPTPIPNGANAPIPNGFPSNQVDNSDKMMEQLKLFWKGMAMIPETSITNLEPIGRGYSANVYRGIYQGHYVCVKEYTNLIQKRNDSFFKEAGITKHFNDYNVIKVIGICKTSNKKVRLISEYADGGTVADFIQHNPLNESQKIYFFTQIIRPISMLHKENFIHRDIKLENILVVNGIPKIADFGFSKQVFSDNEKMTILGTPEYCAPELLRSRSQFQNTNGLSYDNKVDVYALGIVGYYILTGVYIAKDLHNNNALISNLANGKYSFNIDPQLNSKLYSYFKRIFAFNPSDRPTSEEMYMFFTNFNEPIKQQSYI
ncbi:hypothetical protein WA158_006481 [Blastocystis sp. Blastoise]